MITSEQYDMVHMYLNGENVVKIARKLGVSRTTIYSWLNNEEIKLEIENLIEEIVKHARNKIIKDCSTAVDKLLDSALNNYSDEATFNECEKSLNPKISSEVNDIVLSTFNLSETQKEQIRSADKNHELIIITGNPGPTGKTTLRKFLTKNGYSAIEPHDIDDNYFFCTLINIGEFQNDPI